MRIAVTGAAGHLGRLVIESLLARGVAAGDIVAVVRTPEKAADLADRGIAVAEAPYEDEAKLTAALQDVGRLVLVSGSEVGKRFAQHSTIVAAARAAGVSFIAYTSLLNADSSELSLAPEHRETEALLAESGIDHAVLRNGWYWENYAGNIDAARATGHLFGSARDARVNGAARRDYAEAAAAVVTTEGHAGSVYELAGQPALTYPEIAQVIGTVIGSEVTYVDQPVAEYQQTLEGAGLPTEVAQMLAGWDEAIAGGALENASTDLETLIGRPATPLAEALNA